MRLLSRPPLAALFAPRRVALVGASDRPGSMGQLLWRNLTGPAGGSATGSGFPGEVVPVTPSAGQVGGCKAYARLVDVEGEVDLAVVAVPAWAVPGVVEDAAAKGVPAAVVLAGGFAETGAEGARLQDALVAAARRGGVRVIGPNSFGVQNADLPLNASMATGLPPGGGGISLVTQSGAYGMALHGLGVDERARFAKVVAAGNCADVRAAELLAYLRDDPATRVVCCFLESLPDGRAFYDEACRTTPAKPVVVARTGWSAAGARAARSHTAALAGRREVWRAAFDQAGVVVARSGQEMLDAARALATQPVPAGPRVAVVTNSGGTGVELADLLAEEGLEVPELPGPLQAELAAVLPAHASPRNPVDVTPVWGRFAELYPLLVERLARSGEVDVVVPVLVQRAAADPAVAAGVAAAVARLRAAGNAVPVYACWVAPRSARPNADLLQEAGVPCFEWPERTARAVGHAVRYGAARARARARAGVLGAPDHRMGGQAHPEREEAGDEARDEDLLAAYGIPLVASRECASAEAAVAAADELGYPVVVKVRRPDLLHKSDAGGVRVGLDGPGDVVVAAGALLALAPGAALVVQHQERGTEVVVGGRRDPEFGPVVMVGLGGVLVEVLGDVAFGLAPLDAAAARNLFRQLRGYPVLRGARGGEPADLGALAAVVAAVGDLLVDHPEVDELDLNPVLASRRGAVAVDWRLLP